ncbi:MAG TPA: hypothetical protein VNZ47_11845 [Candidatus Dormibacteraeota bacterium]|jgi:hypothetical protein|nr:hypothetical protein [Candidatus Dormibacteraeota bacterium]
MYDIFGEDRSHLTPELAWQHRYYMMNIPLDVERPAAKFNWLIVGLFGVSITIMALAGIGSWTVFQWLCERV